MSDMLQTALTWLAAQQKAYKSQTVTYRRGQSSVEILATLGESILRVTSGNVSRIERPAADFIFTAADLNFGAGVTEPAIDDIVDMTFGDVNKRFRVLPVNNGDEPAWRYTDPYQIQVRVHTKQVSQSDQVTLNISGTFVAWTAGKAGYSRYFTSSGGVDPGYFEATGLPTGLTINESGRVTGTPIVAGTFTPRITATDGVGDDGSRDYSVTINAAIVLAPTTLPDGTMGVAYSQQITATGGTGALVFSAGSLPTGLTLTSGGLLAGTPSVSGDFSFTVTATDTVAATGQRTYNLHLA